MDFNKAITKAALACLDLAKVNKPEHELHFNYLTDEETGQVRVKLAWRGFRTMNMLSKTEKVLESEIGELTKKLIEKERDCERLHSELSFVQKRPKGSLIKSKSLDGNSEQQNVDLKRQLQVIEQEASVLRTKTQTLESENEKLHAENKKLQEVEE